MAEPPELWVFAIANLIVFGFGSLLTILSLFAFTRSTRPAFRDAALGFGLITLGGLTEPVYQLAIRGDYDLGGRELLALQAVEGILIALGLGLLFYSIKGYASSSQQSPGTGSRTSDHQHRSD